MSTNSGILSEADAFVREYLVWRGFYASLQTFQTDSKEDSLAGLSPRRLILKLTTDVEALRLESILGWWDDGVWPLMSRVDEDVAALGRTLRDSTYRWYIIMCYKQQRTDLILSFFKDHWATRAGNSRYREEWKRQWFALPYMASPERDRYFSVYFSSDWRASLIASLENYLGSIMLALPPPRMVSLASSLDTVEAMRAELATLRRSSTTSREAMDIQGVLVMDGVEKVEKGTAVPAVVLPSVIPELHVESSKVQSQQVLAKRQGAITRTRFSPSCSWVASTSRDASAVITSVSSGTSGAQARSPRLLCDSTAYCLDWYDDSLLCVGTLDHAIHLWSPSAGAAKLTSLRSSPTMPWILDVAFDPSAPAGSSLVVSAAPAVTSLAGELQLWNTQVERVDRVLPMEPVPSRINSLRFNHNGTLLVGGSADGMIRVFDASRAGAIMGWPAFSSTGGVSSICLSRAETSVFALSADGSTVSEFSLHRVGELLRRWTLKPTTSSKGASPGDLATSASWLAVARNGSAEVFNLVDTQSAESTALINGGTAVDWDDDRLACGGIDGSLMLMKF